MNHKRDFIRVGKVQLAYEIDKGWRLPGGGFTKNPLKAQRLAELEWELRKPYIEKTIPETAPYNNFYEAIADRRGLL